MKVQKFVDGSVQITLSVAEAGVLHDALVDAATDPVNQTALVLGKVGMKEFLADVNRLENTLALALTAPSKSTFAEKVIKSRVPCAYGSASCAGVRFAPNGVGSKQHTTCEKGRAALKAARA
jgi:hypothetical protein